ncbi:hypothetical protein GGX14DRAFT_629078 [Mycena pura]|uniref:Uncharacterized protein n=1 Tax=Mycena pura TaxID=153505 RepID=A0AAD6YSC0_9AGAR|nr:hypothetical protein GGX14DRAFT_629078 [Mycena pura]
MPIARDESISEATFSTGAKALRYVLANITPDELHEGLLKALTPRSARTQADLFGGMDHSIALSMADTDSLLEIFKAAGIGRAYRAADAVAVQSARHCVRCHRTFFEIDNGLDACCVTGERDGRRRRRRLCGVRGARQRGGLSGSAYQRWGGPVREPRAGQQKQELDAGDADIGIEYSSRQRPGTGCSDVDTDTDTDTETESMGVC